MTSPDKSARWTHALPTFLMREYVDVLLPYITMFCASLTQGRPSIASLSLVTDLACTTIPTTLFYVSTSAGDAEAAVGHLVTCLVDIEAWLSAQVAVVCRSGYYQLR